jgi:hypothetical protein
VRRYDGRMSTRRITYAEWQAERERMAAWVELVDRAMPEYQRRRPRDPEEAAILRRMGTPERLIGPTRTN